jgi:hypothetical protein
MNVLLLSDRASTDLADALRSREVDVAEAIIGGEGAPATANGGEIAALAAALRAAEAALADRPATAAVAVGDGDWALAAALVAVKLGIPLAWLPRGAPAQAAEGAEPPLLQLVADHALQASDDPDAAAGAIQAWIAA